MPGGRGPVGPQGPLQLSRGATGPVTVYPSTWPSRKCSHRTRILSSTGRQISWSRGMTGPGTLTMLYHDEAMCAEMAKAGIELARQHTIQGNACWWAEALPVHPLGGHGTF